MDALDAYRVIRQAHPTMVCVRGISSGKRPSPSPLVLSALADKLGIDGACAEIRALIPDQPLAEALCAKLQKARQA